MELEIKPDPTPEERAAIERALEQELRDLTEPPPYRSRWRDSGVPEDADERG